MSSSEIAALWHDYRPTGLLELPGLARAARVGRVVVKLESARPLGNFKVLGGMVAGLRALARSAGAATIQELFSTLTTTSVVPRLVCASDGNHGLAVAAAAARAGTGATVFLPETVGGIRAGRIEAMGGQIVRVSGTYDAAVLAAAAAAAHGEGILIADTSSEPRDAVVRDVMAGYGLLTAEIERQIHADPGNRPSHVFVQAGVGGLAAAMADGLRGLLKEPARFVIVEPAAAACVTAALAAGRPVRIPGDLHTCAEMLSCGLASAPALEILLRSDARAVVVAEDPLLAAVSMLAAEGPRTTPSGAAGLAGLMQVAGSPALRVEHGLDIDSAILLVVTEGPLGDPPYLWLKGLE